MTEPYWECGDYLIQSANRTERSELLRDQLAAKYASVYLARDLGMGEGEIERLVDNFWDPLREVALNPATVDIVLELVLSVIDPEGLAISQRIQRQIEEFMNAVDEG
jgi:hypothetical protein